MGFDRTDLAGCLHGLCRKSNRTTNRSGVGCAVGHNRDHCFCCNFHENEEKIVHNLFFSHFTDNTARTE